jgi:hypothetical protein
MTLEPHLTREQLDCFIEYATSVLRRREAGQDVSPALEEFLAAVYAKGFVVPYDWMSAYALHARDLEDAALLQSMDLDAFRRAAITHLRMDRFSEGHLKHLLQTGYFAAMAERARQLRTTLRGTP